MLLPTAVQYIGRRMPDAGEHADGGLLAFRLVDVDDVGALAHHKVDGFLGVIPELLDVGFGDFEHIDVVHNPAGQLKQFERQPVTV